MNKTLGAFGLTCLLLVSACGGDDDDAEPADEPAAEPAAEPADEPAAEPAAEPAGEPAAEPAEEPAAEPADSGDMVAGIDLDAALAADLNNCEAEPTGEPIDTIATLAEREGLPGS